MKKILIVLALFSLCLNVDAAKKKKTDPVPAKSVCTQWTPEQAREWWADKEWPVGCCFVPSYAVNQFEMWQDETFNIPVLDKEFGICEELGFNLVRIYLHEKLWWADAEGFKNKINKVLDLCASHGLKVTFTFCTNGGKEQELGPQPEPRQGIHGGGQWCCSPSTEMMNNPELWPRFKEYLQDILRTYKDDDRILYWCLQNEPENIKKDRDPLEWMKALYEWAWEVRPSQPLSSPVWQRPGFHGTATKLDQIVVALGYSDIITFHCYYGPDELETFIKMLSRFRRPMVCQEYMGRTLGSTFEFCMPILKREKVGALNWGLVEGKCKYRYPWGHKPEQGEPEIWFHSIFWEDYTPWRESEVLFIKNETADKSVAGKNRRYPIE